MSVALVVIGSLLAGFVGIQSYVLGVLVSAQGQILKATLDGAINSSPYTREVWAMAMKLLLTNAADFDITGLLFSRISVKMRS